MQAYQLGKLIGSGSFGQVFLCRHKGQQKYYVVKKLRMMEIEQKQRENIQNELKILQRLRHPNIVSYKDSFTDKDGSLCIVMSYCESGDMDVRIRSIKQKGKTFTEAQILDWLIQTSLAIHYLHNQRILHRDLKTQNLFLRKDQRVRLGDFGIAKMLDNNQDLASTVIGTPYYMAPELFKYKSYSYKSDIWSFGIILYQMCNLRRPFEAQSYQGLAVKILKGTYPSITPTYSKQLRDLIISMLSYKPHNRPSIVDILNKGFLRKRLQKYINDMLSRAGTQDTDEIYLDTLRSQAQLLNVSILTQQDTISKYPSSKELQKRWTRNIFTRRGQQQENEIRDALYEKRKSTFQRDSHSMEKNLKRNQYTNSSSDKSLNLGFDFKDEKQAFIDHKKKTMMEREHKQIDDRNMHDAVMRMQTYGRESYYQENVKRFRMQQDYSMDQEDEEIQENLINQEIIREDSDEDLQETMNFQIQEDQQVPQRYNTTYYKLLYRARVLQHMCETAIGMSKYVRARKAVNDGCNKNSILEILGPQLIGYWHIIDQIIYLESVLKKLPKQ